MPSARTNGVRVSVSSLYLPGDSNPSEGRYVFAYTVTIRNEGRGRVQLQSRHWIVTDAMGREEHVRGPGVVGKQPELGPNEAFSYTSGSVLRTEWGMMQGSYTMVGAEGDTFEAEIPTFLLANPEKQSGQRN